MGWLRRIVVDDRRHDLCAKGAVQMLAISNVHSVNDQVNTIKRQPQGDAVQLKFRVRV